MKVTERRGKRRKQLLIYLMESEETEN